jgi:hypothetical protein
MSIVLRLRDHVLYLFPPVKRKAKIQRGGIGLGMLIVVLGQTTEKALRPSAGGTFQWGC